MPFLARINNFAHSIDNGPVTVQIIPGIKVTEVSTVFRGSSVGLTRRPLRVGHRKSRSLPNIGTFRSKVVGTEPNGLISGL